MKWHETKKEYPSGKGFVWAWNIDTDRKVLFPINDFLDTDYVKSKFPIWSYLNEEDEEQALLDKEYDERKEQYKNARESLLDKAFRDGDQETWSRLYQEMKDRGEFPEGIFVFNNIVKEEFQEMADSMADRLVRDEEKRILQKECEERKEQYDEARLYKEYVEFIEKRPDWCGLITRKEVEKFVEEFKEKEMKEPYEKIYEEIKNHWYKRDKDETSIWKDPNVELPKESADILFSLCGSIVVGKYCSQSMFCPEPRAKPFSKFNLVTSAFCDPREKTFVRYEEDTYPISMVRQWCYLQDALKEGITINGTVPK